MMSIGEELRRKTRAYWELSSIWNGQINKEVSAGDAIELCTKISSMTSLERPLSYRVEGLLDEIVRGEGNGANPFSTVLDFPAKKMEQA